MTLLDATTSWLDITDWGEHIDRQATNPSTIVWTFALETELRWDGTYVRRCGQAYGYWQPSTDPVTRRVIARQRSRRHA